MDGYWDSVEKAGMDDNPYRAGFAQLVVVADTDADAERIYLKHLRNFYSKSLYVAPHFGNVPGFMTKNSSGKATPGFGSAATATTPTVAGQMFSQQPINA